MDPKHSICVLLALSTVFATFILHANVLKDPTQPPAALNPKTLKPKVGASQEMILESTLVAPDRRVAVINGKSVSEGELINGARVIEIRIQDVLIQKQGRRIRLLLLPDIVERNR